MTTVEEDTGAPAARPFRGSVAATAAALLLLAAFALVQLTRPRPAALTDDMHGWRQADTQTIARNFAFVEPHLLRPRVDWGGSGPGYVETELQLYPALVAVGLRLFGDSVWPGRLTSLALMLTVGWISFRALSRRFGAPPALAALLLVPLSRGWFFMATAIQPEPLTLLAYTVGFFTFLRFVEDERRRDLVLACAATTVCGLVKPPALQLLVVQLLLVLLLKRRLLRRADVWLGWAGALAMVVAFFLSLPSLDPAHGNSFGILGGGGDLFPHVRDVLKPATLWGLVRMTAQWGTGVPAVAAALFLLWKRQLRGEEVALAGGALAMGLATAHITSHMSASYFHVLSSLLGAWLIAHAARVLADAGGRRAAVVLASVAGVALALQASYTWRTYLPPVPETALAQALRPLLKANELIVVRSPVTARDPVFGTATNFRDPRVFYVAGAHGWVVPHDGSPALLESYAAQGARYYVESATPFDADDPALAAWLAASARLLVRQPEGRIYALGSSPGN